MTNLVPTPRFWRLVAAALGLTAVALAAAAAHAIADPKAALSVERAAIMQLIHAVLLVYLASLPGSWIRLARWATLLGLVLFCGGIYTKYFAEIVSAGALAPAGGVMLMLGWMLLGLSTFTKDN
jgi:uncharacterized membrane protein YgdD (TMEM256/DUF423 family)